MSARVSTALSSFLTRANIRGFVFDIADLAEFPGGSFETLMERAGAERLVAACPVHPLNAAPSCPPSCPLPPRRCKQTSGLVLDAGVWAHGRLCLPFCPAQCNCCGVNARSVPVSAVCCMPVSARVCTRACFVCTHGPTCMPVCVCAFGSACRVRLCVCVYLLSVCVCVYSRWSRWRTWPCVPLRVGLRAH